MDSPERGPETTQRPRLSREVIAATAVTLVDERGLPALTMRSLGDGLGVEAMSLYRYVNGREDLLDAIAEEVVAPLTLARLGQGLIPGWQGFLQHLAHAVRAVALGHPRLFPLIATRSSAAPWICPPLRTITLVEEFLDGLITRGFTGPQAVAAYRTFTSFLVGHLLARCTQSTPPGPVTRDPHQSQTNAAPGPDLTSYPRLTALRDTLAEDHADAEFELALEACLDRIETDLMT